MFQNMVKAPKAFEDALVESGSLHCCPLVEEHIRRCHRAVAEFKETLLRSLLPREMDDNEAVEFLKGNAVQFVVFPDGREELHGFHKKLGDVFYGVESSEPKNGMHFVTRFTPA